MWPRLTVASPATPLRAPRSFVRTGPTTMSSPRRSAPSDTTMGELLDVASEVTESSAELVWFTPEEIDSAGIAPWTELPIWVPPTGPLAGLHDCDVAAALDTGLLCRPIRDTIEDTWGWLQRERPPDQRDDRPVHGLDPIREAALIDTP